MALGDSSVYAGESYLGIARETALGTYATCTASLDFLSSSIKVLKDSKILQQIERKRAMAKHFSMSKTIEGDLEFYPSADVTVSAYILQNAFGGAEVTSATATGETLGGASCSYTHTFLVGSFDATYAGLSFNHRKGGSTGGKVWEYHGGRCNTLSLVAEIDEPLKATASFVFKDCTQSSNDIESGLTVGSYECLSFESGRFSVEGTFASLTASSFWHVQNINFVLNNNLKNDTSSRRIGSDILDVLPVGVQSYDLSVQVRFDTLTAYNAMIAATEYSAEFEFQGTTYSGSLIKRGLNLFFPKITIKDAGDPEIGGPDETLLSTITFNVLRDDSSASGYACSAELTNQETGY